MCPGRKGCRRRKRGREQSIRSWWRTKWPVPLEVDSREFEVHCLSMFYATPGITAPSRRRAIHNVEVAEKASRWLWLKRDDQWGSVECHLNTGRGLVYPWLGRLDKDVCCKTQNTHWLLDTTMMICSRMCIRGCVYVKYILNTNLEKILKLSNKWNKKYKICVWIVVKYMNEV